jgi:hypothetical protein
MTATLRVPRSRGALSGLLLVLLGLWGALMPLIGPYFHFGFSPDKAWHFTNGRVWLQIVPGVVVLFGGLVTLGSSIRAFGALGAWLATLGGALFVIGAPLSALWADHNPTHLGPALGDTNRQVVEQLTLLYGLGVVAVFLGAIALGRLAVVGVKDAALAEQAAEQAAADQADRDDLADRDAYADRNAAPPAGAPDGSETTVTQRRPHLPRRAARDQDARPVEGPWPERVPPTPTESMDARTTAPSDVKVAGDPNADTRDIERPGANA